MSGIRQRLGRLEKLAPKPREAAWPDFDVRCAGVTRSAMQIEMIRRLRLYADDPRATNAQRERWLAVIPKIESALRWQLESESRRACPRCEYPRHDSVDGYLHKCRRCGCPVHVHGDGHVTDARPGATAEGATV